MTDQLRRERNTKAIEGLHKAIAHRAKDHVILMEQLGLRPLITDGYRSVAQQNKLYAQGRTTPGSRVTNARGGESWHNWKLAYDVAFLDGNGKLTYGVDWKMVGKLGKEQGLSWGGDWFSFQDKPHFQLSGDLTIKGLLRSETPYQLIDSAMLPYMPHESVPSEWAIASIEKAKGMGITEWDHPQQVIGSKTLGWFLKKLGLISKVGEDGITKEQFAVAMDRAKMLDQ